MRCACSCCAEDAGGTISDEAYNGQADWRQGVKATIQKSVTKKQHPLMGMLVALASICGFLAVLVLVTILIHFVMM